MESLVLGKNDQFVLDIIYKVSSGQLSRIEAQVILGKSERTIKRYLARFRAKGVSWILHGNRGRKPVNKTPDQLKIDVQKLIEQRYYDLNMLHLQEKLRDEHEIDVKRETLRKWCHEINLVKKPKKRRSKPRYRRERMSQEGLLVMMDGSHHRWFGDTESCLIATIDDSTSEVPAAQFFKGETTVACLEVLKSLIEKKGIFKILYVDRAGVFGGIKRNGFSQVERAMSEMGTEIIYANSPQAKGRVERLFGTLQDRLIPEMRLRGITTIDQANDFLINEYLPQHHNPKFRVEPHNPKPAYVKLHQATDLSQTFCVKEYRQVNTDHTISLRGERYLIDDDLKYSIAKQRIEIRFHEGQDFQAYFAGRPIRLAKINKIKKLAA